MNLSNLLSGVKLDHVAKTSGIPLSTLWRWKERNEIAGKEPVREFHLKRIKDAVKKLRAQRGDA